MIHNPVPKFTKVVQLLRKSMQDDDYQIDSIDSQRAVIKRFRDLYLLELDDSVISDGTVERRKSAIDIERSDLEQIIRSTKEGSTNIVIVSSLDRLIRENLRGASDRFKIFSENDVRVIICDLGPNIYDLWTEEHFNDLLEESKKAFDYSKRVSMNVVRGMFFRGIEMKSPPAEYYGYEVKSTKDKMARVVDRWEIIPDQKKLELVKTVIEMYSKGVTKIEVLRFLNLHSDRENEFSYSTMENLVSNPLFYGIYRKFTHRGGKINSIGKNGQSVEYSKFRNDKDRSKSYKNRMTKQDDDVTFEKRIGEMSEKFKDETNIESVTLFDEAVLKSVMDRRQKKHSKNNNSRFLFSGMIYCGHCGRKMKGRTRRRKEIDDYLTYECVNYIEKKMDKDGNRLCEGTKVVNEDDIFGALIDGFMLMKNEREKLKEELDKIYKGKTQSKKWVEVSDLLEKYVRRRKRLIAKDGSDEDIDECDYEIANLRTQMKSLENVKVEIDYGCEFFNSLVRGEFDGEDWDEVEVGVENVLGTIDFIESFCSKNIPSHRRDRVWMPDSLLVHFRTGLVRRFAHKGGLFLTMTE